MMTTVCRRPSALACAMAMAVMAACAAEKHDEFEREALDEVWDDLTPSERVDELLPSIESELDAMESGRRELDPDRLAQLMSDLSGLRAQMWGTDDGRAEYRELQRRMGALK